MKNLLLVLGLGSTLLVGCSSSSRMGYTYFDDVYDNRPSYANDRRSSSNMDERLVYRESSENYQNNADYYKSETYNNNYIDDEYSTQGAYTERLRRFHNQNTGFDYYSPYYTGYNNGFNYGVGIGTGFGYSNFGSFGSSLWNPWYSSSLYFGWGRPSWNIGFNSWYTPTFFDPFYYSNVGWGRPWYNTYNSWGSPWGWGNNHHYSHGDRNPVRNNSYYGPRNSGYGNTIYNGQQYQGGRMNNTRGVDYNGGQQQQRPSGTMRQTPKGNVSPNAAPATTPSRTNQQRTNPNVPQRYQQSFPSNNSPSYQRSGGSQNSGGGQQRSGGGSSGGGSMQRTNK